MLQDRFTDEVEAIHYRPTMSALMPSNPSSEFPGGSLSGGAVDANDENNRSAAVIIPIDAASVQRIVAGQAITDLASAVKELVDNALDAGSKTINSKSS